MNIDALKVFLEVALLGSFAATARKLQQDPSSVSRSIATLEEELGIRLFQRSTRRLELTEAGEIYLNRIKPLIDEFDHALDDAHQVSSGLVGTLKITTSVSFGQAILLPLLIEFKKQYPNIKLELLLTDAVLDVVAEGIDLSCRLGPAVDSDLIGTSLLKYHYHVCVSPDYFDSHPVIETPDDLRQHQCLVFNLPDMHSQWLFKDNNSQLMQVDIQSGFSISNAMAVKQAALSGMGPAMLADWMIRDDIKAGRLITILDQYEAAAQDFNSGVWLLYPSRQFLPNKTRIMIDFLKQNIDAMDLSTQTYQRS